MGKFSERERAAEKHMEREREYLAVLLSIACVMYLSKGWTATCYTKIMLLCKELVKISLIDAWICKVTYCEMNVVVRMLISTPSFIKRQQNHNALLVDPWMDLVQKQRDEKCMQ